VVYKIKNDYPLFGLAADCSWPLLGVLTNNDHVGLTIWCKTCLPAGFVGEKHQQRRVR